MKFIHFVALLLLISAFSPMAAQAQSEVDEGPFGAPEPNPSPTAKAPPPPVFYATPAESVTGAPAPNPSPAGEVSRPPVLYSTPGESVRTAPPAPRDLSREDFENLHYQKKMWREYQRDYNQNSPQPRNGLELE